MNDKTIEKVRLERIAAWDKIRTLPTIESQAMEWFCCLCSYGHQLPAPYTEYFNGECGSTMLQLHSGFWKYGQRVFWVLKLSDVTVSLDRPIDRWLAHTLELLFHSMPHQVLVVEKLEPLFPADYLSSLYWPYTDGWLVRFRGNLMAGGEFHPAAFKPLTREQVQELGVQVPIPQHLSPQRRLAANQQP